MKYYFEEIHDLISEFGKFYLNSKKYSDNFLDDFMKSKNKNLFIEKTIGIPINLDLNKNLVNYIKKYYDKGSKTKLSKEYYDNLEILKDNLMKNIYNVINQIDNIKDHQNYINHYHYMQRILPRCIDGDKYYKDYKINDNDIYDMQKTEYYIITTIYNNCHYIKTLTNIKFMKTVYNTTEINERDLKLIQPILNNLKCINFDFNYKYEYDKPKKLIPLNYLNKKKIKYKDLIDFWFNSDNFIRDWFCYIKSSILFLIDNKDFQNVLLKSKTKISKLLLDALQGDNEEFKLKNICDYLTYKFPNRYYYLGLISFVIEPYFIINDIFKLLKDIKPELYNLFGLDINNNKYILNYYLNKNKFNKVLEEKDLKITNYHKYIIIFINNPSVGYINNKSSDEILKDYHLNLFEHKLISGIVSSSPYHYQYIKIPKELKENYIWDDNNKKIHCLLYKK